MDGAGRSTSGWGGAPELLLADLSVALGQLTDEPVALPVVELAPGWAGRWSSMVDAFALDEVSEDLLLLAVVRRLEPRIALALQLVVPAGAHDRPGVTAAFARLPDRAPWTVEAALSPEGQLRRRQLLDDDLTPGTRVLAHLRGDRRPSPGLVDVVVPRLQPDPRACVDQACRVLTRRVPLHLRATSGAWSPPVAATALALLGWSALVLDLSRTSDDERLEIVRAAVLEGALQEVAVVLGPWESLGVDAAAAAAACVSAVCPVITYGDAPWPTRGTSRGAVEVDVPPLTRTQRVDVLTSALMEAGLDATRIATLLSAPGWSEVALEADELQHLATSLLAFQDGTSSALTAATDRLSERTRPSGTRVLRTDVALDAVVVTATVQAELRAVVDQARFAPTVLDAWGLGRLTPGRRGTSALLCGPPGTGKTLSASAIAAELGRPLHVVDVGAVVDKYIGETEKRLERIFAAVEQSRAVLLFDEADALFGKRGAVSDARDRFANIEVSYLLQRLEDFDGVLLMTTNMRSNLDEAFLRRIDHVITLDLPGPQERAALWRLHLVPELPGSELVDVAALSEPALSGGEIRNALLSTASRCAAEGTVVDTAALLAGADRELRKQGHLVALR